MLKLVSWNVNSLRVRMGQVLDWLKEANPDVLALQETKLEDALFPRDEFTRAGYHAIYTGQKTYNGVAILSRSRPSDLVDKLPGMDDNSCRLLAANYEGLRVVNLYVPNGEAVGSDKYAYKLRWLSRLEDFVAAELARYPRLVVLGDFNIAPDDRDVHDPELWSGSVLCSDSERTALKRLFSHGLYDSFRLFDQEPATFSWWDYRAAAFRRNLGLRIDLVLLSEAMRPHCVAAYIDRGPRKLERPSDHAPVVAEFDSRWGADKS